MTKQYNTENGGVKQSDELSPPDFVPDLINIAAIPLSVAAVPVVNTINTTRNQFELACEAAFDVLETDKPVERALKAYGDALWSKGGGIPARAFVPNQPWATFIAERIGFNQSAVSMPASRAILAAQATLLPFAVEHRTRVNTRVILDEIEILAPTDLEWSRLGLDQRGERRTAVRTLVAACAKHSVGGPTADAEAALRDLVALGHAKVEKTVVDLAQMLLGHIGEDFADDDLPCDARARMRILLSRRGLSIAELARATGSDFYGIKDKVAGLRRLTRKDRGWLQRIEDFLEVEVGSIADRDHQFGKRGVGNPVADLVTIGLALDDKERQKIALYLPMNHVDMSDAQKMEHATMALSLIAQSVTPEKAAQVALRADSYRLGNVDGSVYGREEKSIERHYTSVNKPSNVVADRATWASSSMQMRHGYTRSMGGYLTSPTLRGAEAVPQETFSIVHLMHPPVVESYLAFRTQRRVRAYKEAGLNEPAAITEEHLAVLEYLAALFHPKNGWATQAPRLQLRLTAIKRTPEEAGQIDPDADGDPEWLVSPAFVAHVQGEAKIDRVTGDPMFDKHLVDPIAWVKACTHAHETFRQMIRNYRKAVRISRDSHEPVDSILRSKDPMSAWRMAVAGLRGELRKIAPDTKAYAEILRDLITIQIVGQTGFRRRTTLALDWRNDGLGHLRKQGGVWRLKVTRFLFKEPASSFFIDGYDSQRKAIYRDYDETLADVDGFYDELDLYLERYRDLLRGEIATDALLLGSRNASEARLTPAALDQMSRRIWNRHLIWNPLRGSGFEGVITTVGWHAWRHIVATAVLKKSRDYLLAADAIQDSVDVCRQTYTRYVSYDRREDLGSVLRACLFDTLV